MNKFLTGLLLTAFVLFAPQAVRAEAADKAKVHEFDFVMAHKPDNEQNVALINEFTKRVFERTNGQVKINPVDAAKRYGGDALNSWTLERVKNELYTGEIGMSQVSLKKFDDYCPTIDALDMPMVFRDHDHVKKVVDGPIGQQVIQDLYKGSDEEIKGLAFTYSGGFRNIYTTVKPVHSVAELNGMVMRGRSNRTSRDAVHYLGLVQNYGLNYDWVAANARGQILAEEAETLRLLTYAHTNPELIKNIKTVLVTNHSVFLTLVAINGDLFKSLTKEQQNIIQEEAKNLAEKERKLSIQQDIDGRKMFEAQGIEFVDISDADKQILKDMGEKIYNKYKDQPVGEVMTAIINTK